MCSTAPASSQVIETRSFEIKSPAEDEAEKDEAPAAPATDIDRSPLFDDPLFGGIAPERFLMFAGFDLWRGGGSIHGGILWAPQGLQRDGFIVKLLSGGGSYRYLSNSRTIRGVHAFDSIMPGYRLSGNGFEVKLFAGIDFQHHLLSPIDPTNRLRGFHTGARINGEFWWEPLQDTMVSSSFSVSSIGPSYSLRAAVGWKLLDSFYIGPEVETLSDFHYRQYRAGVHVTALRTGMVEWTGGTGYAFDSSRESGVYGRLGLLIRR